MNKLTLDESVARNARIARIEDAQRFAHAAFAGGYTQGGDARTWEGMIRHSARVAQFVRGVYGEIEELVSAAWLHDVLEDTNVTADGLRREGFTEATIKIVEAVSRNSGEKYADYIARVNTVGGDAVRIKVADLVANLSDEGISESLVRRYHSALQTLAT